MASTFIRGLTVSVVLVLAPLASAVWAGNATVWFVDDDGAPGNGCTSWADACPELQSALAVSGAGDQVWVAAGTYTPDQGGGQTPGDRSATFQLINSVGLYGGFQGTETNLGQRAGLFNQTILSGDLAGDDTAVACAADSPDCDAFGGLCADDGFCIISGNNGENSYHVVTGTGTVSTAELNGFTVTGGNADGSSPNNAGAGLRNTTGSPTVSNCTFTRNHATTSGGGMRNVGISNPQVTNCTFSKNSAGTGGGMFNATGSEPPVSHCTFSENFASGDGGGGMFNQIVAPTVTRCVFSRNSANGGGAMLNAGGGGGVGPTLIRCTFIANSANTLGGGVYNASSTPTVSHCAFIGNSAGNSGGAINNSFFSSPTVTHCTFSGNSAGGNGGGMGNNSDSSPTITNCSFSNNTTDGFGGAIFNASLGDNSPALVNSLLWGNVDDVDGGGGGPFMDESAQLHTQSGTPTVDYSIVQGGWSGAGGAGVLASDPLFADADGPDDIAGTDDDDLRLQSGSPAIDAGDNTAVPADALDLDGDADTTEPVPVDLQGNPRFIDELTAPDTGNPDPLNLLLPLADMGAYESGGDCNDNAIPDECDLDCFAQGALCFTFPGCGLSSDCNNNGVPDECDVTAGSHDCNSDGVPDECQTAGNDCDANGIPDDCQPDCDENGINDACAILAGAADCDYNGVPDTCDIVTDPDCNANGILDTCDIEDGISDDCNLNDIPDECEDPAVLALVCVEYIGQCMEVNADAWSCTENWDELPGGVAFPDNDVFEFSVTLSSGFAVELDVSVDIDTLRVASGANLDIPAGGGDLAIVQPGGMRVRGAVQHNDDRVVTISGVQRVRPGGSYVIQDSDGAVRAQLSTGSLVLTGSPESNMPGGSMSVEGSSDVTITGDLQMANQGDKGSGTPPDFNSIGDGQVTVTGDVVVQGAGVINYSSTELLRLDGNFVNLLFAASAGDFDWLGPDGTSGVEMTGEGGLEVQTIEAAGQDIGPWPGGLVNNFAFGVLRLAPGATVQIVDTFDNQNDGVVACDEALYVNILELGAGATLLTSGCHLYYKTLVNSGGTIQSLNLNVIRINDPLATDFDGDGVVGGVDLAQVLGGWGACALPCTPGDPAETCATDVTGDCAVGADDLAQVLGTWGPVTP